MYREDGASLSEVATSFVGKFENTVGDIYAERQNITDPIERLEEPVNKNTIREAVAHTIYTVTETLKKYMDEGKEPSTVVEKLTPWEMYLCAWEQDYRATLKVIETLDNDGKVNHPEPESVAKTALLWLYQNNGEYANQPFDIELDTYSGTYDPRTSTHESFRAAVRQKDGTYSILTINNHLPKALATIENEGLFIQTPTNSTEIPKHAQVVVDNRIIAPGESWFTADKKNNYYLSFSMNNKGINMQCDHLVLDGVSAIELGRTVGEYAKRGFIPTERTTVTTAENEEYKYKPILAINNLAPTLKQLKTTEMMQAYARAMMKISDGEKPRFSPNDTILIPQIGETLDQTESYNAIERKNRRIQPMVFRLGDLATGNVGDRFKETATDISKETLHEVMSVLNDPKMDKRMQRFFQSNGQFVPILGSLIEKLHGVGLLSTPAAIKVDLEKEEKVYGERQSANVFSNTMHPLPGDESYNLLPVKELEPDGTIIINYSLAGKPGMKPSQLRHLALLIEKEAQDIVSKRK